MTKEIIAIHNADTQPGGAHGVYSPVVAYCTEEVRRQGHDVAALGGLQRVQWMLRAWTWALAHPMALPAIWECVLALGQCVEPELNARGWRRCGVKGGAKYIEVPPDKIHGRVMGWCAQVAPGVGPMLTADAKWRWALDLYKAFEEIHPFYDGNGRTGKILLNWMNGTLADPVFPADDLWGERIVNP